MHREDAALIVSIAALVLQAIQTWQGRSKRPKPQKRKR